MQADRVGRMLLAAAALLVTAGCATGDEWVEWQSHPTHFASGDHFGFSMRNREGMSAAVSRQDIATARDQGWWGRPITVNQEQILER